MPPSSTFTEPLLPEEAHNLIAQYLIADGFPIVFDLERSQGSWVVDARTGKRFLDFYSFFASLPLGFQHPAFREPGNRKRMLEAAIHKPSNSDADTVQLASFVASFSRYALPAPFRRLFFIEGGTLAVENALKTAFDWKVQKNLSSGRPAGGSKILHFREAFHGRSGYTLSLTNTLPVKTAHFPKFDWPRITNPKLCFPLTAAELERVAKEEEKALEEIRSAFFRHPDEIAAIIIEPIQGEGGDNHFRGEFLQALRDIADEEEALLVFDEVQTGFGLTGRLWAFQHFDAEPDILCFGKKTQVCGIMAGPRVDEVEDNVFRVSSRINSTWGGNLADMARCQIIMEVMEREKLVDNAGTMGTRLLGGLRNLEQEFPKAISNARGRGLFCALDLPDTEQRNEFLGAAQKEGVLLLACGARSVRMRPALTIGEAEIGEALSRLRKVLA